MAYINKDKKFIFVHIPKTAGNSVKSALGIAEHNHSPLSHLVAEENVNTKDYFTFAFVRNPYSRLVSAYNFIKSGGYKGNNECDIKVKEKFIKNLNFKDFVLENCYKIHKKNELKRNYFIGPVHFSPQTHFIDTKIDFVGKVENLQKDFDTVCDNIGIPHRVLKHKNTGKKVNYLDYYDDQLIEIVQSLYHDDFQQFNYKFGE